MESSFLTGDKMEKCLETNEIHFILQSCELKLKYTSTDTHQEVSSTQTEQSFAVNQPWVRTLLLVFTSCMIWDLLSKFGEGYFSPPSVGGSMYLTGWQQPFLRWLHPRTLGQYWHSCYMEVAKKFTQVFLLF